MIGPGAGSSSGLVVEVASFDGTRSGKRFTVGSSKCWSRNRASVCWPLAVRRSYQGSEAASGK